jgi:hypothetical protein
LAITNSKKFANLVVESNDLIAKLGDPVIKSTNSTTKLEHILTYMVNAMKDERVGGYNGIWMSEKDKSALMDSNYFQVDIKDRNHREMNKVLKKTSI